MSNSPNEAAAAAAVVYKWCGINIKIIETVGFNELNEKKLKEREKQGREVK